MATGKPACARAITFSPPQASLAYLGPIDRISSLTLAAVPASWSTDEVQTYTSANAKAPSTQSGGAGTPSPASTPGAPTPSQAPPSAATGMALKSNACPTDNPRVGTPVAVVGTVTAAVAVLDDTCQGPSGQPQTGFTVFLQDSAAPGSGIAVALPCDLAGPLASSDGFLPPVGSTAQVLGTLVRVPGALAPVIDPSAMFLVETIASDRPVPSWVSSDTLAAIAGVNLWPWWGGAGTGATSCGPHPAGAYLGLALALPHVVAVPVDGASIATIQLPPGSFPAGTWAASTTQPASPSSPAAAPQPATPPTQPPATPPPMSPPGPSSAVTVPPLAGAAPVGGGTRRAALAARALQAPAAQRASEASSRRVRQATHAAHAALTKAMQAGGTVLAIATVPESVASLVQAAVDAGDIALGEVLLVACVLARSCVREAERMHNVGATGVSCSDAYGRGHHRDRPDERWLPGTLDGGVCGSRHQASMAHTSAAFTHAHAALTL